MANLDNSMLDSRFNPSAIYGYQTYKIFDKSMCIDSSGYRIGPIERRAIWFLYRNRIDLITVSGLASALGVSKYSVRDMVDKWVRIGWAYVDGFERILINWRCIPRKTILRVLRIVEGSVPGGVGDLSKKAIAYLYRNNIMYVAHEKQLYKAPRDGKTISIEDLANALGVPIHRIGLMMSRWCRKGFAERIDKGIYRIDWERIPRYVIDIALLEHGDMNGDG